MSNAFKVGTPACPVACRYCFITQHEERRSLWNRNSIAGVNKACTFINVSPWIGDDQQEQKRFNAFPWHVLKGDFVGFTAITDPFWPKIEKYLWAWVENASSTAKLLTCVTKWPISTRVMRMLAQVTNFYLVVGITGNYCLERVKTEAHLRTLQLAKEFGVPALPIAHPYISGVSDLSFLPEIKALGYDFFDVKGLRYCDKNMASWMPEQSKPHYVGKEDREVLPEDGWREKVRDAGLELMSPRQWYLNEGLSFSPHLSLASANELVSRVFELANVVSSDADNVRTAAVDRRL